MNRELDMKNMKYIHTTYRVGKSCIECPFFRLESSINCAYAWCAAPDLDRAINNDITSRFGMELKVSGEFSRRSIIDAKRPKWCPLRVGDFIITQNE